MVKNLRKIRKEKELSQERLANIVGTSRQNIQRYENKKIEPDIAMLIKIANALATSVDYLIGAEDDESNPHMIIEGGPVTEEEINHLVEYRKLNKNLKDSYNDLLMKMPKH